jgi:hypothetical protein
MFKDVILSRLDLLNNRSPTTEGAGKRNPKLGLKLP